jgi:hypothetical protein
MFDRKKWRKEYQKKNKKHINDYSREYYYSHLKQVREYQRTAETNIKFAVLIHYGGNPPKCACCGESHIKFLTIDHINSGGKQHRKKLGLQGSGFYRWLKRNGFPKGYQILCYNCNCGRAKNNGICPHRGMGEWFP